MTPNLNKARRELSPEVEPILKKLVAPQTGPRGYSPCYENVLMMGYFHPAALYGLYLCFTEACFRTIFMVYIMHTAANIGITAGAHRLWAHRAHKAKLPLQIVLALHSLACETSVLHRRHHKYTDTDADPHNAARGFFFSHIGWLVQKHPEAKKRRRVIDMSDLRNNLVLKFQKRYVLLIVSTTVIPMYFWGESLKCAWHINILRVVNTWHVTFLVISAAHAFGNFSLTTSSSPRRKACL